MCSTRTPKQCALRLLRAVREAKRGKQGADNHDRLSRRVLPHTRRASRTCGLSLTLAKSTITSHAKMLIL